MRVAVPHRVDIALVPWRPRHLEHDLPAPHEQHYVHEAMPLVLDELVQALPVLHGQDPALETHEAQRNRLEEEYDQNISQGEQRRGAANQVHLCNSVNRTARQCHQRHPTRRT